MHLKFDTDAKYKSYACGGNLMKIAFFGPFGEDVKSLLLNEASRRGHTEVLEDADVVFLAVTLLNLRSLDIAAKMGKAFCPILGIEFGRSDWILEVLYFATHRVRTIIDKPLTDERAAEIFDAIERGETWRLR